ncbi:hypothetical protein F9B85_02145 [Heliorestis acidaminivorans]|uniref:RND related barrel-sandwich hybrid domain-containing protein n=1 Tax=Heliorestis acidaminivorans TaxID=553427 RepID=A0A6I0F6A2_9FIRM|nr:HlyD family efflux transporter periplasmic adaptor subunit [Heliorestis acidaminivorans]KAB2954502.1 hypothetical protein F9B85_02145 [Heliorestis acidaminivorans]
MSRLTMVPLGKEAMSRRRRSALLKVAILVLLIITIALFFWFLKGKVTSLIVKAVVETEPASMGQIADTRHLPGWIIRDETIVYTPITGRLESLIGDGERVRLGAPVARVKTVNPSGEVMGTVQDFMAPRSGLVVYNTDGLEDIMTPRVLEEIDVEQLSNLTVRKEIIEVEQLVYQGQALFKVINNLDKAHFLAHYNIQDLGRALVPGARLTLALSPEGPTMSARVINVRGGEDAWVVLQISNPPTEVIKERQMTLLVVDRTYRGFILPEKAIVQKEGQDGLLLSIRKKAQWRPVEVLAIVGDQVVVEGIREGDLVVLNPQFVVEGQEIK